MKKIFLVLLVLLLTSPLYADMQDMMGIAASLTSSQVLVKTGTSDTKPTQLTSESINSVGIILVGRNTASTIAIGGPNVTTATGLLLTGNYLQLNIANPSKIYLAAGPATASVSYIVLQR